MPQWIYGDIALGGLTSGWRPVAKVMPDPMHHYKREYCADRT